MNIDSLYQIYLECNNQVSTDSRNCPINSLFFALKGDNFDGNKYADSALSNGASYAVIDNEAYKKDNRYIVVENTLESLQQLANFHRKKLGTPIIGITGTNGKTTTKELIAAVLTKKYKIQFTKGNLNNHIGVPLTLLSIRPEHELAVVEMGANHLGEIKFLTNIVEPNYGIITNVGKAHLEGFGSFEGVIKTKSELYDYLREQKDGVVFVDADNDILSKKVEGIAHIQTYGTTNIAEVIAHPNSKAFTLEFEWNKKQNKEVHHIKTQLIGNYNLSNALAAVTIGLYFEVPSEDIDTALTQYEPNNNRSQAKKTEKNQLIIDAYNANPTSMMAALTNFAKIEAQNKVVILGDMKELGKDSLEEHQKIVNYLTSESTIQKVILVGDEFSSLDSYFEHYKNVEELRFILKSAPLADKTILIKGSNSIKLASIIDEL